ALLASVVLVTGALGSVPARAEPESAVRSDSESSERSEGSVPARIWADVYTLWIYAEPRRSRQPLGYLRAGQSAVLRSLEPFSRAGCKDGWFAVEPGGYICASDGAVFKPSRYVRSMGELLASVPPYPFHYALSD